MLSLRYGEQLRHTLVHPRELRDESGDLLGEDPDLLAEIPVLSAQLLEFVHIRVEIILGDPCRSPFVRFRRELAGTIPSAPR